MGYAPLDLSGRVAFVFDGTSGIGRANVHGLAEAGDDVIPTSMRGEQVESVAAGIEGRGRRTLRVTSDVAVRESVMAVLDAALTAFGKVDILVNSAGRNLRVPTLDLTEEDWGEIRTTNLTGGVCWGLRKGPSPSSHSARVNRHFERPWIKRPR